MSPKAIKNNIRTNVFFAPETIEQLKTEAQKKGTTVSCLIRMIVLEHLEQK